MANNQSKFFIGLLQILVAVGVLLWLITNSSGCEDRRITGVYKFNYHGNIHTVVLNKDKTATVRYSMSDDITHTYWTNYSALEPPHIEVDGVILINTQTHMGYTSDSDMRSKQNGYPIEKVK